MNPLLILLFIIASCVGYLLGDIRGAVMGILVVACVSITTEIIIMIMEKK